MSRAKISGLSHLTLAVTDLERSIRFYHDLLGCELRATWDGGAYLEAGPLWLCLSVDGRAKSSQRGDYTHYAFSVEASRFDELAARIRSCTELWKVDASEGASLYFLDPDAHRLELHVGTLNSRLDHYRSQPNNLVRIIEDGAQD